MIKYVILGIIQGFTEFLPVSSSGHLVIFQKLLGLKGEEIALTIVLHLGTLLAVIMFFSKDILKIFRDVKYISFLLLATFITGIIGILGKDFFESLFSSPKAVALALIFTGIVLLFTRNFNAGTNQKVGFKDTVILGLTQAIAIIPGVSRSGMTVSTLLFRKIEKEECFRFSFLVSIPVILGATLLEIRKIDAALKNNLGHLAVGFLFSLFAGLAALAILKLVIKRAKFYYFGYYCILMGGAVLLFIK
jgi:undecaprenyl-diphosphatase